MESNQRKKPGHGPSRSKGRRKTNHSSHPHHHLQSNFRNGNGTDYAEATNREGNERRVLFQIGSIACYEAYDTESAIVGVQTSMAESTFTSLSSISSDDMIELKTRKEENTQMSYEDSQQKRRNLSNVALHGSPDNNTPRSQASSASTESLEASSSSPIRSPPVQVMEREGYDPERIPSLGFEKSGSLDWSEISNDSLFSLSIGDNSLARDIHLCRRYSDFRSEELLKSGELLAYCPSLSVHLEDSEGKASEAEEEQREMGSEEKTSMPILSWRDLSGFDNSVQALSHSNVSDQSSTNLQYFSSQVTKKSKKKSKARAERCLSSCFPCRKWETCLCGFCCCSCCCCYSTVELEIIHGEMGKEKNSKGQKAQQHKWFCCCTA